jgi:hypothetical protein
MHRPEAGWHGRKSIQTKGISGDAGRCSQSFPPGREKFLSIIAATQNLKDREKYESKRRVANLGKKYLTLEMPSKKGKPSSITQI